MSIFCPQMQVYPSRLDVKCNISPSLDQSAESSTAPPRGYCQRRLAEDWGDGPAIVGTACLFTFAHAQYQVANAYNAGMIAGLLLSAVGFGVVFAWTRSLIPAILAHAIFDVPMTPRWRGLLVAALVVGAVFSWRRAITIIERVFATGVAFRMEYSPSFVPVTLWLRLGFAVWSMWLSCWWYSPSHSRRWTASGIAIAPGSSHLSTPLCDSLLPIIGKQELWATRAGYI